jgi:hypothetical protein
MVDMLMAKKIGIEQAKDLVTIFTQELDLVNTHFQIHPDQIKYNGRIFNIISVSNWLPYDDWKSLVCVEDTRYTSGSPEVPSSTQEETTP